MAIEVITQYKCPETGKLWPTEKQARDCAARAKVRQKKKEKELKEKQKAFAEKEYRRNYIRLNAKSPSHAIELLISKSEEFWGIKFTVKDPARRWIKTTAPLTCLSCGRIDLWGEIVDVETFEKYFRSKESYVCISDFMEYIEFRTGSGANGRFDSHNFSMDIYIRLRDFPLIKENYQIVTAERKKIQNRTILKTHARSLAYNLSTEQPEYRRMHTLLDKLHKLMDKLDLKMTTFSNNFVDRYINEFWEGANPPPQINENLQQLFSDVN
jgi:hypothetical protein